MAKLTPEERAELEARLAEDDADDESDEIEYSIGDETVRGSYRRVSEFAESRGKSLRRPKADAAADEKPKGEVKRFQSGRRVS